MWKRGGRMAGLVSAPAAQAGCPEAAPSPPGIANGKGRAGAFADPPGCPWNNLATQPGPVTLFLCPLGKVDPFLPQDRLGLTQLGHLVLAAAPGGSHAHPVLEQLSVWAGAGKLAPGALQAGGIRLLVLTGVWTGLAAGERHLPPLTVWGDPRGYTSPPLGKPPPRSSRSSPQVRD